MICWTSEDGERFLKSLCLFNSQSSLKNEEPNHIISPTTGCLLAFSGSRVAKCPPRHLSTAEQQAYIANEFHFGVKLPPQSRVVESIVHAVIANDIWRLSKASPGLSVLVMRRLDPDESFLSLTEKGKLPLGCGEEFGKLLKLCHERSAQVPFEEALAVCEFDAVDLECYLESSLRCHSERVSQDEIRKLYAAISERSIKAQEVMKARAAAGLFREVHGDLHIDNLWFFNGFPTFIDPMPKRTRRRVDSLVDVARVSLELLRFKLVGECQSFWKVYGVVSETELWLIHFLACRHSLADIVSLSKLASNVVTPRSKYIWQPLEALHLMADLVEGAMISSNLMKDN